MNRFLLIFIITLIPALAYANAGLPILAILWPLSLPAFFPVVFLESYVLNKNLALGYKKSFVVSIQANIISTIIGLPLAWVACLIMEILLMLFFVKVAGAESYPTDLFKALPESISNILDVIMTFPWLGPGPGDGHWVIPFATSIMLIPCFFVSYWMELFYIDKVMAAWPTGCRPRSYWMELFYINRELPDFHKENVKPAVWRANLYSYGLLFIACVIWLITNIYAAS